VAIYTAPVWNGRSLSLSGPPVAKILSWPRGWKRLLCVQASRELLSKLQIRFVAVGDADRKLSLSSAQDRLSHAATLLMSNGGWRGAAPRRMASLSLDSSSYTVCGKRRANFGAPRIALTRFAQPCISPGFRPKSPCGCNGDDDDGAPKQRLCCDSKSSSRSNNNRHKHAVCLLLQPKRQWWFARVRQCPVQRYRHVVTSREH
jgi:hypothetical protein